MKNISWLIAVLALGSTACGTQWTGNYSGTWTGTLNSQNITNPTLAMTLYQSGSNINGYWLATGGTNNLPPSSGQLTGTVSGSTLTVTSFIIPTGETSTIPGVGTLTGSLTLNSSVVTGSLSGSQTTPSSGTLTANVSLTQSR